MLTHNFAPTPPRNTFYSPTDSAGIRRNPGIPTESAGIDRNSEIPPDSVGIHRNGPESAGIDLNYNN